MGSWSGPTRDEPASIDGLAVTNWKQRTGAMLEGPFSACVKRWLDLPTTGRQNSTIGWGPNQAGQHGHMECHHIIAYVLCHGLPPGMLAFNGARPSPEEIRRIVALDRPKALTEDELRQLPLGHSSPP